ncbi:hypothetical protein RIF29_07269 [Crotalaria pallida]|uniref:Uncharacterized protein n=1 Tax=Crotalaria pallida TaxID=3830 RepID=A0AAN9J3Z2_CROPI
MVWFQCEDCGDNLKKPKLPGHFRTCSAYKLSCIDCGQIFGQDTVQNHTQCITEAEKYGPKGQGKSVTPSKPNKDNKEKPEVDINVGLSQRPPWFCSLCNTKATSQQTLLLHADGKKHRARARAANASKQQPAQTDKSTPDAKIAVETATNGEVKDDQNAEPPKLQEPSKEDNLKPEKEISSAKKKRKLDASEGDLIKKSRNDTSIDTENGEVIQGEKAAATGDKNKIKWKKFIKSALKSQPDGILKMKKLKKAVHKALQESGIAVEESVLSEALQQKINSSSRFAVENKLVRLVA